MSYWIEQFQAKGALWIHDSNPRRPHALLTSGNHSNGYFNSDPIIEDAGLLSQACYALTDILKQTQPSVITEMTRVVGPAMGAIAIATLIAKHLQDYRTPSVLWGYTLKEGEGESKTMAIPPRVNIQPGESILLVEDVITTGSSILLAKQAVIDRGATPLPFILSLVNRSEGEWIEGMRIVSLIHHPMPIWKPIDCRLCHVGSQAIKPKTSWTELTAEYPTC